MKFKVPSRLYASSLLKSYSVFMIAALALSASVLSSSSVEAQTQSDQSYAGTSVGDFQTGIPSSGLSSGLADWSCLIVNSFTSMTYLGSGNNAVDADFDATSRCQQAGMASYCEQKSLECAAPVSMTPSVSCMAQNTFTNLSYLGKGHSNTEAKARALMACDEGGMASYCKTQVCSQ